MQYGALSPDPGETQDAPGLSRHPVGFPGDVLRDLSLRLPEVHAIPMSGLWKQLRSASACSRLLCTSVFASSDIRYGTTLTSLSLEKWSRV